MEADTILIKMVDVKIIIGKDYVGKDGVWVKKITENISPFPCISEAIVLY